MIAEVIVVAAAIAGSVYVAKGFTRSPQPDVDPPASDAAARKMRALDAILDLEAEVASGKLSEEDFAAFKTDHAKEALAAIRELDVSAASESDELELEIAAARERLR